MRITVFRKNDIILKTLSSIDQYKHQLLGFIECPSTFDFVDLNSTRTIAIYKLLEDIPIDETDFDGKVNDIIVGGGSGEAPSFRISIPKIVLFFTESEGWDDFENINEVFKAFWTPTQSYILCEGFAKLGWKLDEKIENWLAENVCLLLFDEVKQKLGKESVFTLFEPEF